MGRPRTVNGFTSAEIQAGLIAAFDVQILWNPAMNQATFNATITDTTPGIITALLARASDDPATPSTGSPAGTDTATSTNTHHRPSQKLWGSVHAPICGELCPTWYWGTLRPGPHRQRSARCRRRPGGLFRKTNSRYNLYRDTPLRILVTEYTDQDTSHPEREAQRRCHGGASSPARSLWPCWPC